MNRNKNCFVAMAVFLSLGLVSSITALAAETDLYDQAVEHIQKLTVEEPFQRPLAEAFSSETKPPMELQAQPVALAMSGVKSFFPEDVEETDTNQLWPMDDSLNREVTEGILQRFQQSYPDIIFDVRWSNPIVNAQAWVSWFGLGKRHVQIFGGLLRHKAIGPEGVSLVLAHEVGHHYGGSPTYPLTGLSCEGQADYWGVKEGLRTVWHQQFSPKVELAIQQMDAFYSKKTVLSRSFEALQAGGCEHPPAACRIETYRAAVEYRTIPECAIPHASQIASVTGGTRDIRTGFVATAASGRAPRR